MVHKLVYFVSQVNKSLIITASRYIELKYEGEYQSMSVCIWIALPGD